MSKSFPLPFLASLLMLQFEKKKKGVGVWWSVSKACLTMLGPNFVIVLSEGSTSDCYSSTLSEHIWQKELWNDSQWAKCFRFYISDNIELPLLPGLIRSKYWTQPVMDKSTTKSQFYSCGVVVFIHILVVLARGLTTLHLWCFPKVSLQSRVFSLFFVVLLTKW